MGDTDTLYVCMWISMVYTVSISGIDDIGKMTDFDCHN